jgi:hypothetical protein
MTELFSFLLPVPTPAWDSVAFGHEKLHLGEHGHPVQPVKVTKLQRLTFGKVWIFFPKPTVLTGDNGCVKHCNITQKIMRHITFGLSIA